MLCTMQRYWLAKIIPFVRFNLRDATEYHIIFTKIKKDCIELKRMAKAKEK